MKDYSAIAFFVLLVGSIPFFTDSRVWGFGVVAKFCFGFKERRAVYCVVGGSFRASHRLGRRISDCVVASRVWGCVGGC